MLKKQKEEELNRTFSDCQSEDDAVDNFIYLTNKDRGEATTEGGIRKCYRENTLGTLLRRLDPIAFNVT